VRAYEDEGCGKKARLYKYECGTMLSWDDSRSLFIEPENGNTVHTQERCKSIKESKQGSKQAVTLEMVQKKLESIGIILNVERLMKNG
jgi:hypothetical protein